MCARACVGVRKFIDTNRRRFKKTVRNFEKMEKKSLYLQEIADCGLKCVNSKSCVFKQKEWPSILMKHQNWQNFSIILKKLITKYKVIYIITVTFASRIIYPRLQKHSERLNEMWRRLRRDRRPENNLNNFFGDVCCCVFVCVYVRARLFCCTNARAYLKYVV